MSNDVGYNGNINTYISTITNARGASASSAVGKGWLVAVAEALGKMADALGQKIEKQAAKLDSAIRADKKDVTEMNAKMQAMTQQMNMLMNAISTIIKTIGEGNTALARKQ
ncbi:MULTISPECIES: hypothetical protein [unclassified Luteimonas]